MKPAGIDQNLSIDDSLLIRIENGASLTYYFWVKFYYVDGKIFQINTIAIVQKSD